MGAAFLLESDKGAERQCRPMMHVFEVYLAPGFDPETLLSDEIRRETQAQVMTTDEARKVGFGGLPTPPADREVRLIAVAQRDARWIHKVLEASAEVTSYRVHEVEG